MIQEFEAAKYEGKWAVFAKRSRTFSWVGKGKRFCQKMAKVLNEIVDERNSRN